MAPFRAFDVREIARERIERLLSMARTVYPSDRQLSKRYVELARRVAMKSRVQIPQRRKMFVCKNCRLPLIPGLNCRNRVRSEHGTVVVITCLECGTQKRYPAASETRHRRVTARSTSTVGSIESKVQKSSTALLSDN